MKNIISAAKTVIVLGAIAAAAVGCKQTTTTAPADTAATTVTPVTTTADTAAKPAKDNYTPPANGASAGNTSTGSSNAGMTGAGAGDATPSTKPAVRNNTGETQGTTPNTSLPVSDGSR